MSITTKLTLKINHFILNINSIIDELIRRSLAPNILVNLNLPTVQPTPNNANFDLKSILDNGIVWCPVPKKRTTAESKTTKKFLPFANNYITKYSKPKTNIVTCLDCGSYHEKGTICGKCYSKVKTETEEIQNQLFKDDNFKYNYPLSEITVLYVGEKDHKEKFGKEKRIFVEMPKKRPDWFNNDLLTKVSTK